MAKKLWEASKDRKLNSNLYDYEKFISKKFNLKFSNNYKDILLRFIEIDEERKFFYNCWFSYSENKSKYVYKECFSINQESTNGYQIDVYSSKEANDRDKIQTNREVEEILNEFGYIN